MGESERERERERERREEKKKGGDELLWYLMHTVNKMNIHLQVGAVLVHSPFIRHLCFLFPTRVYP